MLEEILNKPKNIITIANYAAILAYFVETILILVLKASKGQRKKIGYIYLDFFSGMNYVMIIISRSLLLYVSLFIFRADGINYNYLSTVFHCYLILFFASCGWAYAYFRGYTEDVQ